MSELPAHRAEAERDPRTRTVSIAILTVSDTRTAANDRSGDRAAALLESAGHAVRHRAITPDEPAEIRAALERWLGDEGIDLVVTTGGTGIAIRDTTVEVARRLLHTEIEGFGELFRRLSHDAIGAPAMLSRAIGGVVRSDRGATLLFCLPGSPHAVELALSELIIPEIPHMAALVRPGPGSRAIQAEGCAAQVSEAPLAGFGSGDEASRRPAAVLLHGVDLAEVERIAKLLDEHPERFRARCFTAGEQRHADGPAPGRIARPASRSDSRTGSGTSLGMPARRQAERYAARFAAKEAALKALGTGWRDGIAWTDIEVVNEPSGRPTLVLHGSCAERAAALGATRWTVTLTHAGGFAFASVVGVS